ncbi:MAG TPA: hypothetical protein VF731_10645 [Solirubrobacterales bacterium]
MASAATREPLSLAYAALHGETPSAESSSIAAEALDARRQSAAARLGSPSFAPQVSSTHYGPAEIGSVQAALQQLDHGSEMASLSVDVATPEEIAQICGEMVVACYMPEAKEMVVSGSDQAVAGVPRDFAIAHEYGHHLANSERSEIISAFEGGTIRWATYERVCQFTRAHLLFPGDQGAHYWQNPQEAFAESYAHLSDPTAKVPWQFTPLLRPTTAALAKIQADLERPWQGPTTSTLTGSVSEAAPPAAGREVRGPQGTGLGSAVALGVPAGAYSGLVQTPLDGQVTVSVQAPPGVSLAVSLQDPRSGRTLARASTGEGGATSVGYANCGRDALRLLVASQHGSGTFQATITKP